MKTIKKHLKQLQSMNCFAYVEDTKFELPNDAKEFMRMCIGLNIGYEDIVVTSEGNLSLNSECNKLDDTYWNNNFEDTPEDIVLCEITGQYIYIDDSVYGYVGRYEGYFSELEKYYEYGCAYYHENSLSYHDLMIDGHGDVLHCDDAVFCEDMQEYGHVDNCYYSDIDECWYFHEYNMPENINTSEKICEYHNSPNPVDISKGTLFKVGFEIEKTDFFGNNRQGDHIGSYDIFKGFELDSSCGVEAITNILPLSHDSSIFQQLCNKAEKVINSNFNSYCGGHINVSCKHMTGSELYDSVKNYIGLFYAMYRFRLKNTYCNGDKSMKKTGGKYSAINQKYDCIEIRIPGAVKNVEQLMFRYKMTFQLMVAAYNKIPFSQYIDNCQNLLKQIYTTKEQLNKINKFADLFQAYISFDTIAEEIQEFINN